MNVFLKDYSNTFSSEHDGTVCIRGVFQAGKKSWIILFFKWRHKRTDEFHRTGGVKVSVIRESQRGELTFYIRFSK